MTVAVCQRRSLSCKHSTTRMSTLHTTGGKKKALGSHESQALTTTISRGQTTACMHSGITTMTRSDKTLQYNYILTMQA